MSTAAPRSGRHVAGRSSTVRPSTGHPSTGRTGPLHSGTGHSAPRPPGLDRPSPTRTVGAHGTGTHEPGTARVTSVNGRPKRVLDVLAATTLLVLLLPVLLVLALLVLLSGPGPALFVQTRVGRDGRPFRLLKFRTMRVGAHAEAGLLRRRHHDGSGPLFKLVQDPRVTPVGRFLRRSSLDELPQLVNVLRGDMSLVGPRPALPEEVARYSERARRRLRVKPGITGLWQVSGRSTLTWERTIALDLRYVEEGSLVMDLWILIRTVPAVLLGRGAY